MINEIYPLILIPELIKVSQSSIHFSRFVPTISDDNNEFKIFTSSGLIADSLNVDEICACSLAGNIQLFSECYLEVLCLKTNL